MNSLRLPIGIPVVAEERFSAFYFVKYIKNTDRAYQRQAVELVNVCRILTETSPQGGRHLVMLKSTISVAEDALRSAAEAGKAVTDKTSNAFQVAEERLLQYRATVHPSSQEMDAMITERMTRAREKDEQLLRLFNQLRERRGSNVACLRTEDAPSAKPCTHSASTPPSVGAEGVKPSPTVPDHGDTQGSPQLLTHEDPLLSIPSKLCTPNPTPTATATPVLTAAIAHGSQEIPAHLSLSDITTLSSPGIPENPAQILPSCITVPSAIPESSSELPDPWGTPLTAVLEPRKDASLSPSDLPSHLPRPSMPRSPSPSTGTEPPSGSIDVASMTKPGLGNGTIRPSHAQPTISSNPLRRSEKKVPPKQTQNKTNMPTLGASSSSPKPSAKVTSTSIRPSTQKVRQSSLRVMPGAYPGMSVDVDISSWVLVSPGGPTAVVSSKMSWITRLFSRLG